MEDKTILELYARRSQQAITETAAKYGPYCAAVADRILGCPEDTEEILNDTWLAAWNDIPPSAPACLRAYLGRITRNLALDRWRREHAAKRFGGETALALEELGDCVSGEAMEDEVTRRELARALHAFLRGLPEGDRRVFLRRYWSVETLERIAKQEGMSVSALHRRLRKLRAALAAHLRKEGIEP